MRKHSICLKNISDDLYQDLKRVQELDNRSVSSIFREGARIVINQMTEQISQTRKKRNTRQDMVGF
tara:strand:+ start:5 stop:202 length:198 start_codon:yes stop_codon:yes gene_type:complete